MHINASSPRNCVCLHRAVHLLLNWLSSTAVSAFSSCSSGSTTTLWPSSERHLAVTSLCVNAREHCLTVWHLPQTWLDGMCGGCLPNCRHRASRKAPLCKLNSYSCSSSTASQFDALFSLLHSITCCICMGILSHGELLSHNHTLWGSSYPAAFRGLSERESPFGNSWTGGCLSCWGSKYQHLWVLLLVKELSL